MEKPPASVPMYNGDTSINELPEHIFDKMVHFFSIYKQLEEKSTAVGSVKDAGEARAIIEKCLRMYKEKFTG